MPPPDQFSVPRDTDSRAHVRTCISQASLLVSHRWNVRTLIHEAHSSLSISAPAVLRTPSQGYSPFHARRLCLEVVLEVLLFARLHVFAPTSSTWLNPPWSAL